MESTVWNGRRPFNPAGAARHVLQLAGEGLGLLSCRGGSGAPGRLRHHRPSGQFVALSCTTSSHMRQRRIISSLAGSGRFHVAPTSWDGWGARRSGPCSLGKEQLTVYRNLKSMHPKAALIINGDRQEGARREALDPLLESRQLIGCASFGSLPWGRIASRHIGETDCMAGHIGLEVRRETGRE
jgi:hypothetical protein